MKHFLVIFALTAVFWLGLAMSDKKDYTVDVRVEATGFDTVRDAVAEADTMLRMRVNASGFWAFAYGFRGGIDPLHIAVEGDGLRRAAGVERVYEALRAELPGVGKVEAGTDSVRVLLAKRSSKAYVPSLDNAVFSFADQYGLYGQPSISPPEVELFGPKEQLDSIAELKVVATTIEDIRSSGVHTLKLEPVWKERVGVKPSHTEVKVYLPVEAYVERQFKAPVTVVGADTTVELHIYPDVVTVDAWVAQRDLHHEPRLVVQVDYADIVGGRQQLEPRLVEFPDYLRPRQVEPAEVQCVIIR